MGKKGRQHEYEFLSLNLEMESKAANVCTIELAACLSKTSSSDWQCYEALLPFMLSIHLFLDNLPLHENTPIHHWSGPFAAGFSEILVIEIGIAVVLTSCPGICSPWNADVNARTFAFRFQQASCPGST